jgi:acetyl-CoA acetyltransferase
MIRTGYRYGHGQLIDGVLKDGLTDAYDGQHMGMCAEKCAKDHGFTREHQDEYAVTAYRRAAEAWKQGWFNDEVVPVSVPGGRGKETVVAEDEEYKKVNFDKISSLKPAFHNEVRALSPVFCVRVRWCVCGACGWGPNTTHVGGGVRQTSWHVRLVTRHVWEIKNQLARLLKCGESASGRKAERGPFPLFVCSVRPQAALFCV